MKMIRFGIIFAILSITFSLIAAQDSDDLQEETLLLTFIPNIQFSPIYVGIEQGYFSDAGYDFSIEYLDEPTVIDLVAAGRNPYGMVSGEQVIVAASRQRPITFIYEWFQQYPVGLVYDAALEVETIADLEGQTIGIPGRFGASYSGLTTLIGAAELQESDFQIEEIGFNAPDIFCVGRVNAAVVYLNNEPLQIATRAANDACGAVESVETLAVADAVDLVSNGWITNQDMIEENEEEVAAFVAAYDRALNDVLLNPARAYLLSEPHIEGLPLDDALRTELERIADEHDELLAVIEVEEHDVIGYGQSMLTELREALGEDADLQQFEVLIATIAFWNADITGYSDLESWENMQQTLLDLGLLDEPVELSDIFTNAFLPSER